MRKPVIALLAALALVALAAIAAGCGSSGSSTDSTASISKPEFVNQANKICETTAEKGEEEVKEFAEEEEIEGEEPNDEVKEQLAEEIVIPVMSAQVQEIRDLGFPEGSDGEEAQGIVEAAEGEIEEAEEEPSIIFGPEFSKKSDEEARAFGLTSCASES